MTRRLLTAAVAALLLSLPARAQWYLNEISALRNENNALKAQIDSLTRQLNRYYDQAVLDLWEGLEGLENDEPGTFHDVTAIGRGEPGLSSEEEELAAKVRMAAPYLIIPWRSVIGEYVDFYTVKKHRSMPGILRRYEKYRAVFEPYFRREGIPEEVMALCIVESAVSPKALSKAGAYGMWQFMPETAREYGLRVEELCDEREDVARSSDAAARFLANAYRQFGDWPTAVLSYNCGAGAIRKAIIRAGGKTDFWSIYDYLPRETRGYLLSLLAVDYVIQYRDELGF